MPKIGMVAVLLAGSLACGHVAAQDCGHPYDNPGRFGPFDYNDGSKHEELRLVEVGHFTSYIEEMALFGFSSRRSQGGVEAAGSALIAGNLDYTLYAFPNHPRALHAMGVWQLRLKKSTPLDYQRAVGSGGLRSADCYYQRAVMFRPDDGMVYHAYGAFLHSAGELQKAAAQYEKAIELMPNSPEPHYNLGLVSIDLGNYGKARAEAEVAYGLGYPLPGLRRRLERVSRAD